MSTCDVFAQDGELSKLLGSGYRARQGQLEMARAVENSISSRRHLLVEAGTGTGKTLAYLVPIVFSGKRAFIVTATKKLQDQLLHKDIPLLQNLRKFTAAVLKGRSNYVCVLKLKEAERDRGFIADAAIQSLRDQLIFQTNGDLDQIRLNTGVRERFATGFSECTRKRCPYYDECYYELAKERAEACDVVVINHSLFAYVLTFDGLLQQREVVVVDEAHELEDRISEALKVTVFQGTVPRFLTNPLVKQNVDQRLLGQALNDNGVLFDWIKKRLEDEDAVRLDGTCRPAVNEVQFALRLSIQIAKISAALQSKSQDSPQIGEEDVATLVQYAQESENLASQLSMIGASPPNDQVRYVRRETTTFSLNLQRADVSQFLREHLFGQYESVVLASATLRIGRNFSFLRNRLGLPADRTDELAVASPFDYATQGRIYIAPNLQPPQGGRRHTEEYEQQELAYRQRVKTEIEHLVNYSHGRAFVLSTSRDRMEWHHSNFNNQNEFQLLRQGERSEAELIENFRRQTDQKGEALSNVLFATKGFWTGVDVPGSALSLVILDRLPFRVPTEPLFSKRCDLVKESGGNDFKELSLPLVIFDLLQGTGRLIRNETDRGVVAILDSRLLTKRYGEQILADLPGYTRVRNREDVRRFFLEQIPEERETDSSALMKALSPNDIPSDILDYRFVQPLGSGAFGAVYAALDKRTGNPVAIKTLLETHRLDSESIHRFAVEARAVAQLHHPNIVSFIDTRQQDGKLFIVMEYLAGGNLRRRLRQQHRLTEKESLEYILAMAQALAVVHSKDIVHRDLKPENVLFDANGSLKIADFGIAHVPLPIADLLSPLTIAGAQPGTVVYMSPEQIMGQKVDYRSDLYTLGVMLYEMLTGKYYFDPTGCKSIPELQPKIAEEPPIPVTNWRTDIGPQTLAVLDELMAKSPKNRIASADKLAARIESILGCSNNGLTPSKAEHGASRQISDHESAHDTMSKSENLAQRSWLGRLWDSILRKER